MTTLCVIGNISVDHSHYPDGRHHQRLGGAAWHIANAAADAGHLAHPVAVIGNDLPPLPTRAGLDLGAVHTALGTSAVFHLTYDEHDQLISLDADHGVGMDHLTRHAQDHLSACTADLIHICCRTPLDALRLLPRALRRPFVSIDFITSSIDRLLPAVLPWLPSTGAVFTSTDEHRLINRMCDISRLPLTVVTDGPRPAHVYRHGTLTASQTPPPTAAVEVSGAGDTITGTFLAHHARGASDADALHAAITAASAHITRLRP